MKIAFVGSRGIPARYSGFETFYEQLSVRLAQRGHQVTVYNRSHFIKDVKKEYKGVRIVSLPSIPTKHLDTITHTALSSLHAVFSRYDVVYYCIVGNSPLVWLPRLVGSRVLLNVDGADWAREKWSGFARWYQRWCEKVATRTANVLVADARVIQKRYRELYGASAVFVPYGANIRKDDRQEALKKWNLSSREYILYVGRFVPENAIDLLIRAFRNVRTSKKLVVVGDAPFAEEYKASLKVLADDRVIFTGYAFGDDYAQLSSHAFCYVQPSAIDGTRPALLDQMGFGNCVLVRNSAANMEVVDKHGAWFEGSDPEKGLAEKLQDLVDHPDQVDAYRDRVKERVLQYYNWDWITDFHEELFTRMLSRNAGRDYDDYLATHPIDSRA